MDRTERFYKTDLMLHDRSIVTVGDFLATVGSASWRAERSYTWPRPPNGFRH